MTDSCVTHVNFLLGSRQHLPVWGREAKFTILSLFKRIFQKELLSIMSETEVLQELGSLLECFDFVVLFTLQTVH